MAQTNLSKFPDSLDSFIQHSDVNGAIDSENLARYQELKAKNNLTSSETDLMYNLLSTLRNKLWLAEDVNKLQDSVVNLQGFFKNEVEARLSQHFSPYDSQLASLKSTVYDRVNQVRNIETNNTLIVDKALTKIYDSQYFNFDNYAYKSGYTVVVEKTANGFVETIKNTNDNSVFATRTTTKNGTTWVTRTVCSIVYPPVDFTETMSKSGTTTTTRIS